MKWREFRGNVSFEQRLHDDIVSKQWMLAVEEKNQFRSLTIVQLCAVHSPIANDEY